MPMSKVDDDAMRDLIGKLNNPPMIAQDGYARSPSRAVMDEAAARALMSEAAAALEAQVREIAEWKAAADTEARMKRYAESQLSTVRRDVLEEAVEKINAKRKQIKAYIKESCQGDGPIKEHARLVAESRLSQAILDVIAIRSLQSPVHAGEGLGPPATAETPIAVSALDRPRSRSGLELGTSEAQGSAVEAGCGQSGRADALRCVCGRLYSKGPDLVISDDAWARIAPRPDGGGVLCPNCIHDRLVAAGYLDHEAPGVFTSGPLASPIADRVSGEGEGATATPSYGEDILVKAKFNAMTGPQAATCWVLLEGNIWLSSVPLSSISPPPVKGVTKEKIMSALFNDRKSRNSCLVAQCELGATYGCICQIGLSTDASAVLRLIQEKGGV